MIQHIAAYLPLASAAALTLCSRSLRQILGTGHSDLFRGIYANKKERQIFLSLLAKDLSLQYACFHCLKLHPHEEPPSLSSRLLGKQKGRPCLRVDDEALRYLFAGRAITFSSIRTAILNRQCLPTPASLFFSNVSDHGCRVSAKFKVVDGRLLMCADHRIPPLRQCKGPEQMRKVRVYLCPHLTTSRDNVENKLVSTLGCALNHTWRVSSDGDMMEKRDLCDDCAGLRSCRFCPTEFVVEEEENRLIRITRWLDLGTGDSPWEPEWRSHLHYKGMEWRDGEAIPLGKWEKGSIRAMWER